MTAANPFRAKAKRKWPKAEWITGRGPFAVLAHCRVLTITLWETIEKAKAAKKQIDDTACGGHCIRWHEIVNLETGQVLHGA